MIHDIYDPLNEYNDVFKDRFKEVVEATFAQLAKEAQVDVEANRETCRNINDSETMLKGIKSSITKWTVLCITLWTTVVIGIIYIVFNYEVVETLILVAIGVIVMGGIGLLFMKVHSRIKELKTERDNLAQTIEKFKEKAWAQMASLNGLFDWDILARMMTKTIPRLEFDPYFTSQRLADLEQYYGWDGSFNDGRSVIYSHSGLINGNPFVLARTRKMEWGQKTYHGELTIHWTTVERGSDGKTYTRRHSETLHASHTAPFPEYYEKSTLIYANTAAPDLTFYRKKNGLAGKEKSLSFKWNEWKLRRKSHKLKDGDFAMMTNEAFEVAFNTSNRNNNHQFAMLFTPLAQENMLSLLKDEKVGFGDDFDFNKNRMINMVEADHMQELDLDMNPRKFMDFDFERAKLAFYEINARNFHAIYFNLAPLLCIPMYQQIRPQHDIYGHNMKQSSTFWEHESLANFWGEDYFKHPECATHCILKTHQIKGIHDESTIKVEAHGYRIEERVIYISKYGGDGCWHEVPVYWDEYLPVIGNGSICMKEDNEYDDSNATGTERAMHIKNMLETSKLSTYRRHIASSMV